MEKYAVFTESTFVPRFELSVSNKIIAKEKPMVILEIVREWIHSLDENLLVYYKGNDCCIDNFTVMDVYSDASPTLVIIRKQSSVRFQLGTFANKYKTKRV